MVKNLKRDLKRTTGQIQLSRSRRPWIWFAFSWGWTYSIVMLALHLAGHEVAIVSETSIHVLGLSLGCVLFNKSPLEIGSSLLDRRNR